MRTLHPAGIISIIAAFAMSVWRAREAETAATYGSARWAHQLEIRGAGLLPGRDGVILGQVRGQYLRHDGPEHVLCFAPTRSGKGVGLVVPTLLTWPGSCIVHDIKGENWTLTSGFRARHRPGAVVRSNQFRELRPTILSWKYDAANGRFATSKMSPTCWSIPKGHWNGGITGKDQPRLAGRSHPSRSLCGAGQDACRRRQVFCPIRNGRSRPRCAQ